MTAVTMETGIGESGVDDALVAQLVSRDQAGGLKLTGEGGLLQQLTKRVLESALDGELTDHLVTSTASGPRAAGRTTATATGPGR